MDLRDRLRTAVAETVAHAVGSAARDALLDLVGSREYGLQPRPARSSWSSSSSWNEAGVADDDEPFGLWDSPGEFIDERDHRHGTTASKLHTALSAGLATLAWGIRCKTALVIPVVLALAGGFLAYFVPALTAGLFVLHL
jgi:hypothetical protein